MDVCVRLFCVCAVLFAGSGLETGWSPSKDSYRLCKRSRNWKIGQDPKGCSAIGRETDRQRQTETDRDTETQRDRETETDRFPFTIFQVTNRPDIYQYFAFICIRVHIAVMIILTYVFAFTGKRFF
jgi:hypothetical protein